MTNFLINLSDTKTLGRNYLINGNFDFWQRGNTAVSGQAYRADRFISSTGNEAYSRGSAAPPVGSEFYAIIARTTATPSTLFLAQRVESFVARILQSKVVTVSFQMRQVAGTPVQAAVSVHSANVRDTFSATTQQVAQTDLGLLTANWQTFSVTFTVNSTMATNGFEVRFGRASVTGPVTFEIAQVKLEEGPIVTPFSLFASNYQDELASCQRYYEVGLVSSASTASSALSRWCSTYKVTKRASSPSVSYTIITGSNASAPTVIISNEFGAAGSSNGAAANDWTAWTFRADAEV